MESGGGRGAARQLARLREERDRVTVTIASRELRKCSAPPRRAKQSRTP